MTETIKAMLRRHEGLVLKPGPCTTGHMTCGYGHNLDASPMLPHIWKYLDEHGEITKDMAEEQLDHDIALTIRDCLEIWATWVGLPVDVKKVTIDLVFNMGRAKVEKEFPNMVQAIEDRDFKKAADELKYTVPGAMPVKYTDYWIQVKTRAIENFNLLREG